jgi:hypothetical protein
VCTIIEKIMSNIALQKKNLLQSIVSLIDGTRERVALTVNSELTLLYWNIGKQINEDILKNGRADYGKNVIAELSKVLYEKYGSGFNKRNLQSFIKFNAVYQEIEILHSLRTKLTWTHIREIIYVNDPIKREFYTQLAFTNDGVSGLYRNVWEACFMNALLSAKNLN